MASCSQTLSSTTEVRAPPSSRLPLDLTAGPQLTLLLPFRSRSRESQVPGHAHSLLPGGPVGLRHVGL
eukprot:scaffold9276_cov112-Isochrysis_galbana.AAC.7